MKDKAFSIICAILLLAVVLFSTARLQVIEGAQLKGDLLTQYHTQFVQANRGLIMDRYGKILAQNVVSYSLYLNPSQIKDENELQSIIQTIGFTDYNYALEKYNASRYSEKILLQKNYNNPILITQYLAEPYRYKGIEITEDSQRIYAYKDLVAHLIGYTGETTNIDVARGYRSNSEIGKAGVELSYDSLLRGIDGKISIDSKTGKKNEDAKSIDGINIYLTIDVEIQQKLTQILQDGMAKYGATGGIGVLQNIESGEVLSYVSLPTYDNNLFVGGIGEKEFDKLNKDSRTPLLDRISGTAYPPGSVFKLSTAAALLETKSITMGTQFTAGEIFEYGNVKFRDFAGIPKGNVNILGGICRSSNIFFMRSSLQMDDKYPGQAIYKISEYAKKFGLDKPTGIDLPEQDLSVISSPELKKRLFDEEWLGGDLLNASIGQGYTLVSPIQIQNMASTIANDGMVVQPRVLLGTGNSLQKINYTAKTVLGKVDISQSTLDVLKQGMYCGPHSGIIQDLNSPYVSVAAKSGTAEFGAPDSTGQYPNKHGWVTGFFPSDKPKYSFTLMLEKGGTSGNSVRLARSFIDWLYRDYKKL